jgi:hypothetical protein
MFHASLSKFSARFKMSAATDDNPIAALIDVAVNEQIAAAEIRAENAEIVASAVIDAALEAETVDLMREEFDKWNLRISSLEASLRNLEAANFAQLEAIKSQLNESAGDLQDLKAAVIALQNLIQSSQASSAEPEAPEPEALEPEALESPEIAVEKPPQKRRRFL